MHNVQKHNICTFEFPFGTKFSNSDFKDSNFNNDLFLILYFPPPKQHSDTRSILMLLFYVRLCPRNALIQWKFRYGYFDTKFVFHLCPKRPSFLFLWNFPTTILSIDPFQYFHSIYKHDFHCKTSPSKIYPNQHFNAICFFNITPKCPVYVESSDQNVDVISRSQ
jgi:hypothetical protein